MKTFTQFLEGKARWDRGGEGPAFNPLFRADANRPKRLPPFVKTIVKRGEQYYLTTNKGDVGPLDPPGGIHAVKGSENKLWSVSVLGGKPVMVEMDPRMAMRIVSHLHNMDDDFAEET